MAEILASEDGQTAESVTTVVRAHIQPDKQDEYEEWLRGINEDATQFAGFQGATILRPDDESHQHPEYVIVVRFAAYSDLRRWEHSPEFADWQRRLEPILVGDVEVDRLTGTETWFTLPGHTVVVPPPQIQGGDCRRLWSRSICDGGYTIAGAIPGWGIAIDWHFHIPFGGNVHHHDLGDHAADDAASAALALPNQVKSVLTGQQAPRLPTKVRV